MISKKRVLNLSVREVDDLNVVENVHMNTILVKIEDPNRVSQMFSIKNLKGKIKFPAELGILSPF